MPNKSDLNKNIFARYPLTFYFIIAYAGSWLVVLPYFALWEYRPSAFQMANSIFCLGYHCAFCRTFFSGFSFDGNY